MASYDTKATVPSAGDAGARQSPIVSGEAEVIHGMYKGKDPVTGRGIYTVEAFDASFNAETGELSLDYAKEKEFDNSHPTNKHKAVDITIQSGVADGRAINLDLSNSAVKSINASNPNYMSSDNVSLLRSAGFDYSSGDKKWIKGYRGYTIKGDHLIADSVLPNDLSGIKRISGQTKQHKEAIKRAGYKWDWGSSEWVKK